MVAFIFFPQLLRIISLGGGITPTIQVTDSWKTHGNRKVEMCRSKSIFSHIPQGLLSHTFACYGVVYLHDKWYRFDFFFKKNLIMVEAERMWIQDEELDNLNEDIQPKGSW